MRRADTTYCVHPCQLRPSIAGLPVKRLNPRRVKIHRSYTVEEVAMLFRVHKNTVRAWLKIRPPADRRSASHPDPGAAARELSPCAPRAQATALPGR